MIEVICQRTVNGFSPINDEEAEKLSLYKMGEVIKVKCVKMRNPKFFGKWWILVKVAYDYWVDVQEMPEYKGEKIEPNFKRFRKDMTILAGHFHYVSDINGSVHAEADSLNWGSMGEDTFQKLYSSTINAILNKIYKDNTMTEEKLRGIVDEVLSFA